MRSSGMSDYARFSLALLGLALTLGVVATWACAGLALRAYLRLTRLANELTGSKPATPCAACGAAGPRPER